MTENVLSLRLNSGIKKCTDPNSTRYVLGNAQLGIDEKGNALVVATTGEVLGIIETCVECEDSERNTLRRIPASVLPRKKRKNATRIVQGEEHWQNIDDETYGKPDLGLYPKLSAVIPELDSQSQSISIDVTLLVSLAAMLKSDKLELFISGPREAIAVRPISDDCEKGVGVLMPCMNGVSKEDAAKSQSQFANVLNDIKETLSKLENK